MRRQGRQFVDWLDDRTGFRSIRHHLLEEQLVPGTGWFYPIRDTIPALLPGEAIPLPPASE